MSNKTNRSTESGQATNRPVANATAQPRDAQGRFSSNSTNNSTTSTVVKKSSNTKNENSKVPAQSSFIKSMIVNEDSTVSVIMTRYPKTVYTYKPNKKALRSIQSTLKNGTSMGQAFNEHLKGREISKTIFK